LRIQQTTYAWGFEFAEDFIIFDYLITNISNKTIEKAYVGVEMRGAFEYGVLGGYLPEFEAYNLRPTACDFTDDVALFWSADNDGQPTPDGDVDPAGPNGVAAIKLLRIPEFATTISYNWWDDNSPAQDWGPRRAGTPENPFRSFGQRMGTPLGDRNRYYVMSSGEFDYDQMFTALDHTAEGWLPPPSQAVALATGPNCGNHNHHWHMITAGPTTIPPGGSVPLTFAYVMGDDFHRQRSITFNAFDPYPFYETFHFEDLVQNATWASWVYDNPGIDTDGDFYRGEYRICVGDSTPIFDTTVLVDTFVTPPETTLIIDTSYEVLRADTLYYTGDGVPDIRAASPPPAPEVRFTPSNAQIVIEWNGLRSETTPDVFTNLVDFEGYRVYLGLARTHADMTLQTSYDIEDFTQYYLKGGGGPGSEWVVLRPPFSLAEVQNAYANGNPDYDPLANGIDNPLRRGDSLFYFVSQDWNQFDLTDPIGIQKAYPNEPYPHTLSLDSAFANDTFLVDDVTGDTTFYPNGELTPDGKYFKYFEYTYTVRDILPSRRYFASVTAFDYGSQEANLPFLETNPVTNAIEMFALDRVDQSLPDGLNVIVYPNPYRADGNYRARGFEGRGEERRPDDRVRQINFINLPPECTIFIYSLDGDLVNRIEHSEDPNSPTAMHEPWNLITRNTQLAVSGIYYWVVETPDGQTQIGKLALIL
ncbi:MAG TPA: hypothetical protein VLB27_10985, partial [candidate division Zixibacteria bacterium]|nr:hypothetical protein [candidate division Zixibacteria bacterium]